MKIQMKQTAAGSENGIRVRVYESGNVYEVGDTLARAFLEGDLADPVAADTPAVQPRAMTVEDELRNAARANAEPVSPARRELADAALGRA